MNFDELLLQVGLRCPEELLGVGVEKIATDSREVVENSIFICIKGKDDDGHRYISKAVDAGARIIVAEDVRNECVGGAALLYAENTRNVASLLYNLWYRDPVSKMKFIGITGTNGKTSVSYMILQILEEAGYKTGLIGTVECLSANRRRIEVTDKEGNMTTPAPQALYRILGEMSDDDVEYVVMEVSSHALVQGRVAPITFDVAVFTNLSEEHLDFHNSMEEYYKAKEKLFLQAKSTVVNIDCGAGERLYSFLCEQEAFVKSCSRFRGDFCALDEKASASGVEYVLIKNDDKCKAQVVKIPLCGGFQVMNSLQAIAAAELCDVDSSLSCVALEKMNLISGRLERVIDYSDEQNDIDVFIDYAHTPDALEKLLRAVRAMQPNGTRVILLFGCGGDRDKSKRKIMGSIASRLADFVVVTSDNSRSEAPRDIINDVLKGIDKEKEFAVVESRKEAIFDAIIRYARSGDTVVLAGKGHEAYEITADGKHPFDERGLARCALAKRRRIRQERM